MLAFSLNQSLISLFEILHSVIGSLLISSGCFLFGYGFYSAMVEPDNDDDDKNQKRLKKVVKKICQNWSYFAFGLLLVFLGLGFFIDSGSNQCTSPLISVYDLQSMFESTPGTVYDRLNLLGSSLIQYSPLRCQQLSFEEYQLFRSLIYRLANDLGSAFETGQISDSEAELILKWFDSYNGQGLKLTRLTYFFFDQESDEVKLKLTSVQFFLDFFKP